MIVAGYYDCFIDRYKRSIVVRVLSIRRPKKKSYAYNDGDRLRCTETGSAVVARHKGAIFAILILLIILGFLGRLSVSILMFFSRLITASI